MGDMRNSGEAFARKCLATDMDCRLDVLEFELGSTILGLFSNSAWADSMACLAHCARILLLRVDIVVLVEEKGEEEEDIVLANDTEACLRTDDDIK